MSGMVMRLSVVSASVPVLMSLAVALATWAGGSDRVLVAGWIAVTVVGTSSVISTAVTVQRILGLRPSDTDAYKHDEDAESCA